jgi:hypothetical protein
MTKLLIFPLLMLFSCYPPKLRTKPKLMSISSILHWGLEYPSELILGKGEKYVTRVFFVCLFLYMNLQFFQHNLLRSLSVPFGLPLHPCQRQWTIFVQNYIFSLLFCSIYLCLLFVKPHCRHDCPFRVSLAKGNMSLPIFFFNSVQGILSPLSFQVDSWISLSIPLMSTAECARTSNGIVWNG